MKSVLVPTVMAVQAGGGDEKSEVGLPTPRLPGTEVEERGVGVGPLPGGKLGRDLCLTRPDRHGVDVEDDSKTAISKANCTVQLVFSR